MKTQTELKKIVAHAALEFITADMIVGIGTGSTINYFIDELAKVKHKIDACVASSNETSARLKAHGIPVIDMNAAPHISLYVDGADEVNKRGEMKKGGGGALTKEKIIATYAKEFLCLVDESKLVDYWGDFPIAVEALPMARSAVARELMKLGGNPCYRNGFITDNGNIILDVFQLNMLEPKNIENSINRIVGVVENGIFANRCADKLLVATQHGVKLSTLA